MLFVWIWSILVASYVVVHALLIGPSMFLVYNYCIILFADCSLMTIIYIGMLPSDDRLPYSLNISREKIFSDFDIFDLSQKFYPEINYTWGLHLACFLP